MPGPPHSILYMKLKPQGIDPTALNPEFSVMTSIAGLAGARGPLAFMV